MNIFNKNILQPCWSYKTNGVLWRLLYSPSGSIVGEVRNTDLKQASFFCLNVATGQICWEDYILSEKWWVGIENVDEDYIYFHYYAQPDMPQHKGIECHLLRSGELLWKNDDVTFAYSTNQYVCAYRDFFEKRQYVFLNKCNGNIVNEHIQLQEQNQDYNPEQRVIAPLPLGIFHGKHRVVGILESKFKNIIVDTVEIIESQNYLIAGFYTKDEYYTLYITVMEKDTLKLVYTDVQNRECMYPVPENFFVVSNMLCYIANQSTLYGIELCRL